MKKIISEYIRNHEDLVYFVKQQNFTRTKKNDTTENLPLRPIVSNVGTATYKTAKNLAFLFSPLTSSEYNINKFVKSIKKKIPTSYKMISFNVKNLFTNVPLDKAIKIILQKIYQEKILNTSIPQKELEKLLYLCTKHVHFSFGGEYTYILME